MENIYTEDCSVCKKTFNEDVLTPVLDPKDRTEEVYICEDCLDSSDHPYVYCDECGNYFTKSLLTVYKSCIDDEPTPKDSENSQSYYKYVCQSCVDNNSSYYVCEDCGNLFDDFDEMAPLLYEVFGDWEPHRRFCAYCLDELLNKDDIDDMFPDGR